MDFKRVKISSEKVKGMPYEIIRIPYDTEAIFLKRLNRFLGTVRIVEQNGREKELLVHIHDPGRLKELLYSGNAVLLKNAERNLNLRKTKFDLIAAAHDGKWVLVHSGYHREISTALLRKPQLSPFGKLKGLKPEIPFGKSRIDYLLQLNDGSRMAVEVKGCTLAINGTALFPDAPTLRGKRHLNTLMEMIREGYRAGVLVLVFREDSRCFMPNEATDADFAETFERAIKTGVEVHPLLFSYKNGVVYYHKEIPLCESWSGISLL